MKLNLIEDLYIRNKIPDLECKEALDLLMELNQQIDFDIDTINEKLLDELIDYLVKNQLNSVKNFVVLMRYYHVINRKDLYIHLTKYTGMLGVMDNIIKRLKTFHGELKAKEILGNFKPPYLGVKPSKLPNYTIELMELLESKLKSEEVNKVLAGNNHSVSRESQLPEKVEYENSKSLAEYLRARHDRKVKVLTEHLEQNKVWFEQIITKEVVEFVANNQEILSGKLKDDKLYITKIPYDTLSYLEAKDDRSKRYYGCHCPFAREAIKNDIDDIPPRFCYCSAGFAKFPFEVILDTELEVKVLNSVLDGSDNCRFEIDLSKVNYKR